MSRGEYCFDCHEPLDYAYYCTREGNVEVVCINCLVESGDDAYAAHSEHCEECIDAR